MSNDTHTEPNSGDDGSAIDDPVEDHGDNRSKGNPAAARKAALLRRKFVYEQVKERARIKLAEIVQRFGLKSKTAIDDDLDFFRSLGIRFSVHPMNGEDFIVDEGVRYVDDTGIQRGFRTVEKKVVAKVAASLVLGVDDSEDHGNEAIHGLSTQKEIIRCLSKQSRKLARHFTDFWRTSSRMLSLDSSTTNEQVASYLSSLRLPSAHSNLSYLSVCTNSRQIFNQIGDPNVPLRAIITGGQQQGRTPTLAGSMTEDFLKNTSLLHFGIAFVGATGIDLATGHCLTDSQDELLVKQQFLSKATTRVVIVDNSKFKKPLHRAGFSFAALNPKQVDVLITNAPLTAEAFETMCVRAKRNVKADELLEQREAIDAFEGYITDIRTRGVTVIVGATDGITTKPEMQEGVELLDVGFDPSEREAIHLAYF